jgi:hypothetical protein
MASFPRSAKNKYRTMNFKVGVLESRDLSHSLIHKFFKASFRACPDSGGILDKSYQGRLVQNKFWTPTNFEVQTLVWASRPK